MTWLEVAALVAALLLGLWGGYLWFALRRQRTEARLADEARAAAVAAQHRTAELAVAAERIRIVREMHDVLAHSLAIMIAQADGGSYVTANPGAAKRAFLTIAETGRAALGDTRRVLGLLRHGETAAPALTAPPEDASLDELITRARAAGMEAALIRLGRPQPLPAGSRMALFRICQEALTNVLKHAGERARVVVTENWTDASVVLTVTNEGGTGGTVPADDPLGGYGLGLIGMRERAEVVGGTLEAGPTEEGFRVRATLPTGAPDDQGEGGADG